MADGMMAPPYTRAQVDNCAFSAWYPKLAYVSIKSEVIELPPSYVSLLLADGVKLPAQIQELHQDETDETDVRDAVQRALQRFKGQVFPKLNWSCPRDASWMLGGSLKCTSYEDVFLLLKASDFIVHDLTQPYAGSSDEDARALGPPVAQLVLKKWCNFYDSMHFRGFVVARRLVAVSQRHVDEYYAFLDEQQDFLCEVIYRFFHDHLRVFPDPDFAFDVYVDKQHRVFLVDLNVFGGVTDPLLFTWEELLEWREAARRAGGDEVDEENHAVEFRIVESTKGIRPHPLSSYRTPTDFVDHLAGAGGFDAFIDQVRRDNAGLGDGDSESESDDRGGEDDDDDDDVKWGSDNEDYD